MRLWVVLKKLWQGQYSFAKAFWGFFVLGIFFVCPFLSAMVAVPFAWVGLRPIAVLIFVGINISYWIIASVGVWRSAGSILPWAVLKKLWWGQYSLSKAFWGFFVIGNIVCPFLSLLVAIPFFIFHIRPIAFLIFIGVSYSYLVIASVGVWRSADAYPYSRWWPALAKIVLISWAAYNILELGNGGAQNIINLIMAST